MKVLVALVSGCVVATCHASPIGKVDAPSAKEAEFRWHAKDMLESLLMPSCDRDGLRAPPGFRRSELLKAEQDAVRAFEARLTGTPAQFHWDVAKVEARNDIAENSSCWAEYGELIWAQKHLEMTKNEVKVTLPLIEELLPSLGRRLQTSISAEDGAVFRAFVRNLIRTSKPRCQLSVKVENEDALGPALTEVARFKQRLAASAYAVHFDIVEGDIAYHDSIVEVECDEPGNDSAAELRERYLGSVKRQIGTIEKKFSIR